MDRRDIPNGELSDIRFVNFGDTNHLLDIHTDPERLKVFFKRVTINCLLSVARRYDLPTEALERER